MRGLVFVLVGLAGCPATHGATDAGLDAATTLDAHAMDAPRDARAPDAPLLVEDDAPVGADAGRDACFASPEVCNAGDDDCDGLVDEDGGGLWYVDVDDDGFGDPAVPPIVSCTLVPGRSVNGNDCDDADPTIHPAAVESCDCAARDENCNGSIDEGCACLCDSVRSCGVSDVGECRFGTQQCTGGAWGACADVIVPVAETCNDLDDDCDGTIDESLASVWYVDVDRDGFGDPSVPPITGCTPPPSRTATGGDCDDADPTIHPAAVESCDCPVRDENCNGSIDESCSCSCGATRRCGVSDVGECSLGTQTCALGTWDGCIGAVAPAPETCNGLDDDCDGTVDGLPSC